MKFAVALLATIIAVVSAASYSETTAMSALYYCKAAYCLQSPIESWTCDACSYHPNFVVKGVYENATHAMQAFTGYNPDTGNIVVAFRGSHNVKNWIADLNFIKTAYPNPNCGSGCEVHRGFLEVWQSMQTQVLPDVQALANQYPSAEIFVTGHSLGAAVSVHCALNIVQSVSFSGSLTVYNFGDPRVGNPAFAQWASAQLPEGKMFRLTHSRDPVPHVPPMDLGFLHLPHELWYDNNGDSSFKNCNDSPTAEDPDCSDSVIPFGVDDHLLYLGVCTECSCSSTEMKAMMARQNVTMPKVLGKN